MKYFAAFIALIFFINASYAEELYFPPLFGDDWETLSPEELGWQSDKIEPLLDFLEEKNTRAFLVLKDGKIVIEEYFAGFKADSAWYWASAGKTLTSFTVGLAQEEGLLDINDPTSDYLGEGWTSCDPADERKITIKRQLTMSSGLDDGVENRDCTDPECLVCLVEPGERWAYHNAPYTLLDQVVESATGETYNAYFFRKIRNRIGMNGAWLPIDYNNVYFSSPRSMARFGILMLGRGDWNGETIMSDKSYLSDMTETSQDINKSYGYLWWLNGKDSYMIPQLQLVFDGSMCPNAPEDMYSALGKNGQILNVVPSENLIVVRMGDKPAEGYDGIATVFNCEIWDFLNEIRDSQNSIADENFPIKIYPNPASANLRIEVAGDYKILDCRGSIVAEGESLGELDLDVSFFSSGVYSIVFRGQSGEINTERISIIH